MKKILTVVVCFIVIFSQYQINGQNVGTASYINVNSIYLPFNNKGIIADVNGGPNGSGGQFAGGTFLFSSGFWLSGYTNDTLWANGVASATLVEDYQAGTVGMSPSDPKASIYKLTSSDIPFGQSWQDWIDAVDLGADFYDGNGDGIYNPVDLNGNNLWDPDEDKPDLLLDETYWCVFNDAIPANQRRWHSEPQGIEVRQTIFASASVGPISKTIFVRYRIKNTGTVSDTLEDVYFSIWADPDIGDYTDDVYGCDIVRQAAYYYNKHSDQVYGNQVPSFMMDLLTGPLSYIPGVTFIDNNGNNIYENEIDTPLDTAVNYLGPIGIRIYPGAKNLQTSSCITYIGGDAVLHDPNNTQEARNYIIGLTPAGQLPDPCTWPYGNAGNFAGCDTTDPHFWFSGDPVTGVGWLDANEVDVRGTGTSGPFKLVKDQEVEILVGYEIDRGTTPVGGITAVKAVSDYVQNIYENNFGYPIVSVEDKPQIVSGFKLYQNYPNPFNPSTKISYSIPTTSKVTLRVFDILGIEVAKLVNEEKPAGEYEVDFNGSNLPSGIYFYQLKASSFIHTKKMILMK